MIFDAWLTRSASFFERTNSVEAFAALVNPELTLPQPLAMCRAPRPRGGLLRPEENGPRPTFGVCSQALYGLRNPAHMPSHALALLKHWLSWYRDILKVDVITLSELEEPNSARIEDVLSEDRTVVESISPHRVEEGPW